MTRLAQECCVFSFTLGAGFYETSKFKANSRASNGVREVWIILGTDKTVIPPLEDVVRLETDQLDFSCI